jgi:hypothetical protein
MPISRRQMTAQATAVLLSLCVGASWAAQPVVEIIAFAHPPVQTALKPLRDWLATQGKALRVSEINMESPEAEKRLAAVGLKGHIPVVVLVDGKYKHTRPDGSTVEFLSFPAGTGTPTGVKGGWSADDVQAVLKK